MDSRPIYSLVLTYIGNSEQAPGWYINGIARGSEEQINRSVPQRKISIAQAEEIARAFENAFGLDNNDEVLHPFELIREGSQEAVRAIQKELDEAEREARRVGQLRKSLEEFGGSIPRNG